MRRGLMRCDIKEEGCCFVDQVLEGALRFDGEGSRSLLKIGKTRKEEEEVKRLKEVEERERGKSGRYRKQPVTYLSW